MSTDNIITSVITAVIVVLVLRFLGLSIRLEKKEGSK